MVGQVLHSVTEPGLDDLGVEMPPVELVVLGQVVDQNRPRAELGRLPRAGEQNDVGRPQELTGSDRSELV